MAHVATITIDHTKVAADLTDFPVAVIANGDAGWAELYAVATEGGGDIRIFKSDDVTELPREIVSFSVSAEKGEIHIKYSGTLSSTVDTDIHIYADGSSSDYAVGATYGRNAVWSAYWGVWHMGGTNATAGKQVDATGNSRNITEFNTPATAVADQWGDADGAYSLVGVIGQTSSTTAYDYLSVGRPDAAWGTNVPFTVSTWFNLQVSDTATVDYIMRQERNDASGANSWGIEILSGADQNKISCSYSPAVGIGGLGSGASASAMTIGDWNHVVARRRATDYYPVATLNGVNAVGASGNGTAFQTNNDDAYVNRRFNATYSSSQRYATGYWSEMRIRADDVGDSWITTEYNNQNSASTFYAVTAEGGAIEQALTATAQATAMVAKQMQKDIDATAQATADFTRQVARTLQATAQATASFLRSVGRTLTATAQASTTLQAGLLYATELIANAQATAILVKTQVTIVTLTATAQASTAITQIYARVRALTATASATASVVKNSTLARTLVATASATASVVQSGLIISRELLVTASASVTFTTLKTLSFIMSVTVGSVVSLLKDFGYIDKYPENDATYEDKYPIE